MMQGEDAYSAAEWLIINSFDAVKLQLADLFGINPLSENLLYEIFNVAEEVLDANSPIVLINSALAIDEYKADFGKFVALYYGLPFALQGDESNLSQLNDSLYVLWKADQSLTSEQRGAANFSDHWYVDRSIAFNAFMLYRQRGEIDGILSPHWVQSGLPGVIPLIQWDWAVHNIPFAQWGDTIFKDMATGQTLTLDGLDLGIVDPRHISFGGDGNDVLAGGKNDDRLYGGEGADTLRGGEGNDYLEGGTGADVYEFTGNFGNDIIFDGDGLGSISIDGKVLGAFSLAEGVYQFEGIQATRIAGDNNSHVLILSRVGDSSGNQIRIEDWQEGHLGITLDNTPPPAPTPAHPEVLLGTNADEFFDLNLMQAGGGTRFGTAIGGGGHDYVWGTTESDLIYGGAGNDWIHGNLGAADQLYGEEGNDFILDASTGTRAYGGAGNDVLSAHAVARVHIGEWGLSSGDFWLLMREYLQPGFVTFVNRVEDIDYHSYSVWMGFTPGTYTFTSAEGVSYQLQVEGADLNAPFSGFHLGTAESDITNLQFLVNGNPQAYNLAWSRFTLNPDWTEEMAAELEGVMFDGGADDDLLVGWYSKDTLIGGDGNEAWGSPIYAKAA